MGTLLTILFFALGGTVLLLTINILTGRKLLKGIDNKIFDVAKYGLILLLILIAISKIWNIQ